MAQAQIAYSAEVKMKMAPDGIAAVITAFTEIPARISAMEHALTELAAKIEALRAPPVPAKCRY